MQPDVLHPARLRKYGLLAVALCLLVAVLAGYYGLLSRVRPSAPAPAFRPQVYDYHTEPNYNIGLPLRPVDLEILEALAAAKYKRADLNDLFPTRPYHVQFLGNPAGIDVVVIDLERDGSWDERWQLKTDAVQRRIIDKTRSSVDIPFMLRRGRWVPF